VYGLPFGESRMTIDLLLLKLLHNVTDGQTERQTMELLHLITVNKSLY